MPRGTSTTPAYQRTAILVADYDGLVKFFNSLDSIARKVITAATMSASLVGGLVGGLVRTFSDLDEDQLLSLIEKELSLSVRIAHYTPEEADELFKFDVGP